MKTILFLLLTVQASSLVWGMNQSAYQHTPQKDGNAGKIADLKEEIKHLTQEVQKHQKNRDDNLKDFQRLKKELAELEQDKTQNFNGKKIEYEDGYIKNKWIIKKENNTILVSPNGGGGFQSDHSGNQRKELSKTVKGHVDSEDKNLQKAQQELLDAKKKLQALENSDSQKLSAYTPGGPLKIPDFKKSPSQSFSEDENSQEDNSEIEQYRSLMNALEDNGAAILNRLKAQKNPSYPKALTNSIEEFSKKVAAQIYRLKAQHENLVKAFNNSENTIIHLEIPKFLEKKPGNPETIELKVIDGQVLLNGKNISANFADQLFTDAIEELEALYAEIQGFDPRRNKDLSQEEALRFIQDDLNKALGHLQNRREIFSEFLSLKSIKSPIRRLSSGEQDNSEEQSLKNLRGYIDLNINEMRRN